MKNFCYFIFTLQLRKEWCKYNYTRNIKKSQLEFPPPSNTKLCKLLIDNLNLLKIEQLLS